MSDIRIQIGQPETGECAMDTVANESPTTPSIAADATLAPLPIDVTRGAVNRLVAATETLAAVGLALARRAGDVTLPDDFAAGVDAVVTSTLGDLSSLEPEQAKSLGALARAMLAQAAGFSSHPQEPSAWAVTDPLVLQSLGQASAALAAPICDLIMTRYPELDKRLQEPGAMILDVGTGVGALALAFANRYLNARVVGVDVWQPALNLARTNVARAGLTDRVEIRHQDVTLLSDDAAFDLVWFAGPFIPGTILDQALIRVARATRPGGVVVYGTFGGGTDPLGNALADLRILRSGGPVLTDTEIGDHLQSAGLRRVECATTNIGMPARLIAAQQA